MKIINVASAQLRRSFVGLQTMLDAKSIILKN